MHIKFWDSYRWPWESASQILESRESNWIRVPVTVLCMCYSISIKTISVGCFQPESLAELLKQAIPGRQDILWYWAPGLPEGLAELSLDLHTTFLSSFFPLPIQPGSQATSVWWLSEPLWALSPWNLILACETSTSCFRVQVNSFHMV